MKMQNSSKICPEEFLVKPIVPAIRAISLLRDLQLSFHFQSSYELQYLGWLQRGFLLTSTSFLPKADFALASDVEAFRHQVIRSLLLLPTQYALVIF